MHDLPLQAAIIIYSGPAMIISDEKEKPGYLFSLQVSVIDSCSCNFSFVKFFVLRSNRRFISFVLLFFRNLLLGVHYKIVAGNRTLGGQNGAGLVQPSTFKTASGICGAKH